MTLKRRIENLEIQHSHGDNLLVIFNAFIEPSGEHESVLGYHIDGNPMLRLEGETDKALEDRAEAAIRAQPPRDARVLVLNPISEEEPCGT